ncbi:MAG: diaminopimelate decarboxylase [Bacteroidaceae bacterium]|nr:diaminopimelate decarboxylase [Bacteroidaceae bacterium]
MSSFPIEAFGGVSTPFYYYDMPLLRSTLATVCACRPPGSVVHYALKANSNAQLLKLISQSGLGADCVSGGEIEAAVACGFAPDKIVYSGVGKTDAEIRLALSLAIACINVESVAELEVIDAIASECGVVAPVAIRVNPHIDAHTHHYITTGLSENKFGIDISQLHAVVDRVLNMKHVRLRGLHFHIGSQITTLQPYEALCEVVNRLQDEMELRGVKMDYINVGGGLGVDYEYPDEHPIPDFASYFGTFARLLQLREGQALHFEPGRSIVCQCGTLISRVLYIKEGLHKRFAIVDAGMTDLMRPALYQASHKIENLTSQGALCKYDVVGPICESSDSFGHDVALNEAQRGDFIAIRSAGAYGESMASRYNSRQLPGIMLGE